MDKLQHVSPLSHRAMVALAEELASIAHGKVKSRLHHSGTEANETASRLAHAHRQL